MAKDYFNQLNYALGDEDSSVEVEMLPFNSSTIVSIAGSGGRIIPLILKSPKKIICYDISNPQLYITELRLAAIKQLSFEEYCGFLGYPPAIMSGVIRKHCFNSLILSKNAKKYLYSLFEANNWSEIIYLGEFEKMLKTLGTVNKFIVGKKRNKLFEFDKIEDQQLFIEKEFPAFRWMISLFTLGNSNALNALLYKGKFPKKNVHGSHYYNYKIIFDRLFQNILCKESFFLQMVFLGKLKYEEGNLLEAQKDKFELIKKNIYGTEIELINSSIMDIKDNEIDFISLSDVPSFLSPSLESDFLQLLQPRLANKGIIAYRGHLRVPNPILTGFEDITSKFQVSLNIEKTQLWRIRCLEKFN